MSLEETIRSTVRDAIQGVLQEEGDSVRPSSDEPLPQSTARWTWKEKLWSCPSETRLTLEDVCEALGRSSSWVYKRTSEKADPSDRLPARKSHGQIVVTAGELRTYVRDHEEVLHSLPMTTTDSERRAFAVVEGRRAS